MKQKPNYLTARENLEIVLSSNFDISDSLDKSSFQNISKQQSFESEKINLENFEKQKPSNFFDEVSIAFSTLGSLFGFLN